MTTSTVGYPSDSRASYFRYVSQLAALYLALSYLAMAKEILQFYPGSRCKNGYTPHL